jgi:hypothetical protein
MVVKVSKPEINVREKISELDKPSGTAGQAMLAAETPQEQFNLISAGRRNLIINGDQRIAQRGTSATGVVGSGYYINDRMLLGCSTNASGTYTLSQSTDAPAGFKNSFKLDCTTANSNPNQLRLNYQVEGSDVSHLNFASHYTIDTANTWEYKTIQIVGDTANTISTTNAVGLTLSFWLTSPSSLKQGEVPNGWVTNSSYDTLVGSDFNVNMASSTSNEWMITGLQLELGKVATPFEHRSYGEELALCQRYFYKHPDSGDYAHPLDMSSGFRSQFVTFPAIMRVAPTLSNVTGSGNYSPANPDSTGGRVHGAYFQWNSVSSSGFVRVDSGFTADAEL